MSAMLGFHALKDGPVEKVGDHAERQLLAGEKGDDCVVVGQVRLRPLAHQRRREQNMIFMVISSKLLLTSMCELALAFGLLRVANRGVVGRQ